MRKIFVLAVLFFASFGALNAGEELYLVVGSVRRAPTGGRVPLIDRLWKEGAADLSHTQTFGGKATTMDREPCHGSARHIKGDATTHDFSAGPPVREVYIERFPTFDVVGGKPLLRGNCLGRAVRNIATAMPEGASLCVEWHPYILVLLDLGGAEPGEIAESVGVNPFTGVFNVHVLCAATQAVAQGAAGVDGPPPGISSQIEGALPHLRDLVELYVREGVGTLQQIRERLKRELWILKEMWFKRQKAVFIGSPSGDFDEFNEMVRAVGWMPESSPVQPGSFYATMTPQGGVFGGTVYDAPTFLSNSFINFLWSDVAVLLNTPAVIEFMYGAGFRDVTVERGTSPCNGRRNVWIVRSVRVVAGPSPACDAAAAGAASSCGEDGAKGDDTKKDGEGR